MKIVLSTRNPSKIEQVKAIFAGSRISILTLDEAGIESEAVEDGDSLLENALKKAMFACRPGLYAMADDTGIFIDALNGAPGIKAARWAGDNATTNEITLYTLQQLEGVADRSATFETLVAVVSPSGMPLDFFTGRVRGKILLAPPVPAQPKMPYSAIFMPDGTDKVWAQMTVEEENKISHRGKAFRQTRAWLEALLYGKWN